MISFGKYEARQYVFDKDIDICSYVLRLNDMLYYRKDAFDRKIEFCTI